MQSIAWHAAKDFGLSNLFPITAYSFRVSNLYSSFEAYRICTLNLYAVIVVY